MEFRRYLYRRKANVTAQSILLAIGYNINKLHYKIQAGRTGRHLFPLKQTAWFWQVKSKSWKRTFFQKRFIKVRLLVETEWKERIFRLKNGKKMLPHLWFPNHWCDSPDYKEISLTFNGNITIFFYFLRCFLWHGQFQNTIFIFCMNVFFAYCIAYIKASAHAARIAFTPDIITFFIFSSLSSPFAAESTR